MENERLRDRIAELTALSGGGPSEVTAAAVGEVAVRWEVVVCGD